MCFFMLIKKGLLIDDFSGMVEFIEDESTASAYIEKLCIFIIGTVDGSSDEKHEVSITNL